ncbi:Inositol-1-monophosphatase [hydrothermal vent metagenome]|uniref:Inositol-1-monophosphatase n=1 Tax=hydrothermal vent metagenome TaxID=652676 RepID=A0A3B0S5U0_9ZZZZ
MHQLYQSVLEIMRQASQKIILPHYQNLRAGDVQEKSPGDYVTIADKLSEEFLTEKLTALLPGATIVGEEAVSENLEIMDSLNDELVWIIDPIDGTGNFANGKPLFGIIIALSKSGKTMAGWLYEPLTDRICHAEKGVGAYINGRRVMVKQISGNKPIAALATGFMTPDQREAVLNRVNPKYEIVDIPRCAAEQYPRLVLGTNQISVFERTLPWDHAAGVLFLNEAGGKAARWDGSPYLPGDGRTGMLGASSPKLWEEAADLLGDIFLV